MTTEFDSTLDLEDADRDLIITQLSRVARAKTQTVFDPDDVVRAQKLLRKFGCEIDGEPIKESA